MSRAIVALAALTLLCSAAASSELGHGRELKAVSGAQAAHPSMTPPAQRTGVRERPLAPLGVVACGQQREASASEWAVRLRVLAPPELAHGLAGDSAKARRIRHPLTPPAPPLVHPCS